MRRSAVRIRSLAPELQAPRDCGALLLLRGLAKRGFVLTLSGIETAICAAAPNFDIDRVYLFGSYARGTANDASDVDLCLETGSTFSLLSAGAFSQSLSTTLGTSIDLTTETSLYDFVKTECLRDRILIYERA